MYFLGVTTTLMFTGLHRVLVIKLTNIYSLYKVMSICYVVLTDCGPNVFFTLESDEVLKWESAAFNQNHDVQKHVGGFKKHESISVQWPHRAHAVKISAGVRFCISVSLSAASSSIKWWTRLISHWYQRFKIAAGNDSSPLITWVIRSRAHYFTQSNRFNLI